MSKTSLDRFYDWFYMTIDEGSKLLPEAWQKDVEEKYYQHIHKQYDDQHLFIPVVVKKLKGDRHVINVEEFQYIIESSTHRFRSHMIYRVPKFQIDRAPKALSIIDLGTCDRWVITATPDNFSLQKDLYYRNVDRRQTSNYRAFQVSSIVGCGPDMRVKRHELLPLLPHIIKRLGEKNNMMGKRELWK